MNPKSSEWWKNEIIKESKSKDRRESVFGSSRISTTYHKNVYSSALKLAQKVHNNGYITEREYNLMIDFLFVHLESTTDSKNKSDIERKLDMCCSKLANICRE